MTVLHVFFQCLSTIARGANLWSILIPNILNNVAIMTKCYTCIWYTLSWIFGNVIYFPIVVEDLIQNIECR